MIKIDTLRKIYSVNRKDEFYALKGVSLILPDKGLVSVLGPSGCGKTTLLNVMSLLDSPTSGSVYFNDVDITKMSDSEKVKFRHYMIGFVFQDYNLIDHLNVFDNVKLGFNLGSSVESKQEDKIVEKLLKQLNIYNLRKRMPNTLSGGEKQRVAIARSLVNNPRIILADEPTGALDSKNSVEVMKILKDLSKDRLVFIVTHNNHLAEEYSDRIIELQDGLVINDSNPILEYKTDKQFNPQTHPRIFSLFHLAINRIFHKKARYGFLVAINTLAILTATVASGALLGSKRFSAGMQRNTLRSYPITISTVYLGMNNSFMTSEAPLFPSDGNIHRIEGDSTSVGVNSITSDYINYIREQFDKYHIPQECLTLRKGLSPTILLQGKGENDISSFEAGDISMFTGFDSFLKDAGNYFCPLYGGKEDLAAGFDKVYGKYPTEDDELIVILDRYDSFPTYMLDMLGFVDSKISYDDFMAKRFRFVSHDEYYGNPVIDSSVTAKFIKSVKVLEEEGKQADEIQGLMLDALMYYQNGGEENIALMNEKLEKISTYFSEEEIALPLKHYNSPTSTKLKRLYTEEGIGKDMHIVGIFRPKKDQFFPYLNPGIYYSKKYSDLFLEKNHDTEFAKEYAKHLSFKYTPGQISTPTAYNIFKNSNPASVDGVADVNPTYNYLLNRKQYGIDRNYYQLEIMARDFKMKDRAIQILKNWNKNHTDIEQVSFSDVGGAIVDMIDKYVGLLLAVLVVIIIVVILFSILVTSLLAILEIKGRIHEIGLYRSLGSSRRFVRALFLVEQGTVGFASGLLGIGLAFLLIPAVNKVIEKAVTVAFISNFAYLTWWVALIIPVAALLIGVISTVVPAMRNTIKNPAKALKEL